MSAALMELHARDVALLGPFEVMASKVPGAPFYVVSVNDDTRCVAQCAMRKDAYMVCAILNDIYNRTPKTHRHVGPGDACAECGRNFRDAIHERLTGAA